MPRRRRRRGGTRVPRRGDPTAAAAAVAATAAVVVDDDVDVAFAVEVERRLGAPVHGRVDHLDPAARAPRGGAGALVRPVPMDRLLDRVYVVWKFSGQSGKQYMKGSNGHEREEDKARQHRNEPWRRRRDLTLYTRKHGRMPTKKQTKNKLSMKVVTTLVL